MGRPVVGKYPTLYFEAAFDFRWIFAPKIIAPGQTPQQDRLSLGVIAAEELTEDEFIERMVGMASEDMLNVVNQLINPTSDEKQS